LLAFPPISKFGAQNAIGDITPAGGWEIVSCDSDSMAQDITIVCQTSDDSGACAHLFSGPSGSSSSAASPAASAAGTSGSALPSDGTEQGAVGKIVRLPEDVCFLLPFHFIRNNTELSAENPHLHELRKRGYRQTRPSLLL
jgi:hypothetical protein